MKSEITLVVLIEREPPRAVVYRMLTARRITVDVGPRPAPGTAPWRQDPIAKQIPIAPAGSSARPCRTNIPAPSRQSRNNRVEHDQRRAVRS